MSKIRVGILRGGPSSEYEVSLNTGATVLRSIPMDKYHPHDIFIDRNGIWHIHGIPVEPHHALHKVDVIFNALHGEYGEDGKVQQILELHQIPFTGSSSVASALGMNKAMSKDIFSNHGIKTPYYQIFEKPDDSEVDIDGTAQIIFRTFPMPAVIKPLSAGSSVGVTIAQTFPALVQGLELAFSVGNAVLVEEFIPGVEATCAVIEGYRDTDLYALPPIEIRPHKGQAFFDYSAKYHGKSDEIVPGNFSYKEKEMIEHMAREAHKALGLEHYSRSDFIVHPRRGIYILETNSQPGLTEESLLPKAVKSIGGTLEHFVDHVIELALAKKRGL